jgi:hypothetical protein
MALKYIDFDLRIDKNGDNYVAEVRDSPAGSCPPNPFDWPKELQPELLKDLELALAQAQGFRKSGPFISSEEDKLRQFGSKVFQAIFSVQRIADLYSRSRTKIGANPNQALRIKLRVGPPELAVLPWEYTYDALVDHRFVCLVKNQHMVRFLEPRTPSFAQKKRGPLRVLAMIAKTDARIDVENERHRIQQAFDKAKGDGTQCELRWVTGGTRNALLDAVQEGPWDIFHFIGHGGAAEYVDGKGDAHMVGFIDLEPRPEQTPLAEKTPDAPDRMFPSELARVMEASGTRLVVLNCCNSGQGVSFSNMGAALVLYGIPQVVAMQFPISDDAATLFSEPFYRTLLGGESVEAALARARSNMDLYSNLQWGVPVLFTRTEANPILQAAAVPATATATGTTTPAIPVPPKPVHDPHPALTPDQAEFRRIWENAR